MTASSEPTAQEEVDLSRASRARLLLEDEMIVQAFADIEQMLMLRMRYSKAGAEGQAERDLARAQLDGLDSFRGLLTRHVQSGKLAELAIEQRRYQEELMARDRELYGG